MKIRPSWDKYFLGLVNATSKRATCDRGESGCVITRDNHILVAGYVGSPRGFDHCDDVGHLFKEVIDENGTVKHNCWRTVHAEQNAICQAARIGTSLENSTLYCTMTPCRICAMLLIQCGITRVVCEYDYHAGTESKEMFKKAKIEFVCINDGKTKY